MGVAGQARGRSSGSRPARLDDGGFIMVALLVAMAAAAVWMSAALPAWSQQAQREREAELVFRGEAIARAIYLYRQENNQALPPSLDTLVSRRYLRKKYLDPMTGKDFEVVAGATSTPGGATFGALQGGIVGVRSGSDEPSIRIYNGQQVYSQWVFDFSLEQMRSGGGPATGGMGPIVPGRGGDRIGGPGGRRGRGEGGRGGVVQPGARGARGARGG